MRSRLGQGQVYGGSETYSEVSGYTSDNHYDRWVKEYMMPPPGQITTVYYHSGSGAM